jgi:hypothetical protein
MGVRVSASADGEKRRRRHDRGIDFGISGQRRYEQSASNHQAHERSETRDLPLPAIHPLCRLKVHWTPVIACFVSILCRLLEMVSLFFHQRMINQAIWELILL